MSAMLAFCTRKRIRSEQTQAELSAEIMNEALDALASAPGGQHVLIRKKEHARWLKSNRTAPVVVSGSSWAADSVGAGASSVFGMFSKMTEESRYEARNQPILPTCDTPGHPLFSYVSADSLLCRRAVKSVSS